MTKEDYNNLEPVNKTHSTHQMRYSDSSYYDEICDACMQPDPNTHTNVKLTEPCTKTKNDNDKDKL